MRSENANLKGGLHAEEGQMPGNFVIFEQPIGCCSFYITALGTSNNACFFYPPFFLAISTLSSISSHARWFLRSEVLWGEKDGPPSEWKKLLLVVMRTQTIAQSFTRRGNLRILMRRTAVLRNSITNVEHFRGCEGSCCYCYRLIVMLLMIIIIS